jgi:hypothetical protein
VTGVRSPTEAEDFSSTFCVQPVSGPTYLSSCAVGTGGPFPGGRVRPGHDADHSPPSSAGVKKGRAIPPLPPSVFMACSGSTFT